MDFLNQNLPYGATPIDADEKAKLIPSHIRTLSELNDLEQRNILKALIWLRTAKKKHFLSISFILKLHKKMFEDVWLWAGNFRQSNKNIGCEWHNIQTELKKTIDDIRFWLQHNSFSIDEIGARLHHRITFIHPFANGNGRFSRLYVDMFMKMHHQPAFSWGQEMTDVIEARKAYIAALRNADEKDFSSLIKFLRS